MAYEVVDLGTLPGLQTSTASGLNDLGDVVGTSIPTSADAPAGSRAVLWSHGSVRDLGTLQAPFDQRAQATDINNRGQVVGFSCAAPYESGEQIIEPCHAFVWQRGHMTDIGTLGGIRSSATAVNERGQVVGVSDTGRYVTGPHGPVPVRHAFLWSSGTMTDLGSLGSDFSEARDINNRGAVVGESTTAGGPLSGVEWDHGAMTPLGGLSAGEATEAFAINDRGQIVGTAGSTPVLWNHGSVTDLTAAGPCPGYSASPNDINNRGEIVGSGFEVRTVDGITGRFLTPEICRDRQHAFLPILGDSAENNATRLSDLGVAVGFAVLRTDGGFTAPHAALWRPVPTGYDQ